ncbi:MAG: hypothetical protein IMF07_07270 [Proteobacteria bacterium]|nr:hypothetical protein [Pseudomonadota bacterium]
MIVRESSSPQGHKDKSFKVFVFLCVLCASAANSLFFSAPSHAISLHGFAEGAYGARFHNDLTRKDNYNLSEARLQLKGSHLPKMLENWQPEFFFKGDILHDRYSETTQGILREAYLFLTPLPTVDLKVGRQILTWGTGDLLFINDLFPKDYVSFMIGRDDEYLKLPSDAIKASFFLPKISIDVILTPQAEQNNSINGERLSFYNGLIGEIVGQNGSGDFHEPAHTLRNMETAARVYRNFGSIEGALYYFKGFYKEPLGVSDPVNWDFFYPRLAVYGASLRGPFAGGIGNIELGYYDSREDRSGGNSSIENSAVKYLAGYEKDMGKDLKLGLQYQLEQMLDYDAYRAGVNPGSPADDEYRHLLTLRLTQLMMDQNLNIGLFVFYSPSDKDIHLRPRISYKFNDNMSGTIGANIFEGDKSHTFFGQLDRNDNIYTRVRYSF